MNLEFKRKLPTLQEIKAMYPIDEQLAARKKATDDALKAIFEGRDSRLVLVIGPCSADREDAVLDYISRACRKKWRIRFSSCRASTRTNRALRATDIRVCFISPTRTRARICSKDLSQSANCI